MAIDMNLQETMHPMTDSDQQRLIVATTLLVTTIAVIKLLLLWSGSRGRSHRRLPPTIPALPVIGGLVRFMRGPVSMIREEYTRLGSVFTLGILGHRITFLIGPEVSEHLFNAPESEMSQQEVYQFTVAALGRGVAFDVPYSVRLEQIRIFAEGLRRNKLRNYVDLMVSEAEEYFSKWGERGTVDLKHELEQLILLITSRCLLGREVRENLLDDVATLFRDLCHGMQPVSVIFPYLPIPAHRRRDRARQRLGEMFGTIIRARKASGRSEEDILQCLIDHRYKKDGRANTEDEIVGLLITMLFGAQETSSITATWTGAYLLQFRRYLAAAVAEQVDVMRRHGDRIDHDVVAEMDVLYRCVKEALRLQPPTPIVLRWSHADFTVTTREGEELVVPKGIVAASAGVANRLPHVYKDPDSYDPDRFVLAPASGGKSQQDDDKPQQAAAAGALSNISFGGGKHRCIGDVFAYLEIKTVWAYLLRNFELEMVSPFPENEWNSMVVGVKGKLMVNYTRRKLVLDGN